MKRVTVTYPHLSYKMGSHHHTDRTRIRIERFYHLFLAPRCFRHCNPYNRRMSSRYISLGYIREYARSPENDKRFGVTETLDALLARTVPLSLESTSSWAYTSTAIRPPLD